jgi:alcohol dehydrogenase
MYPLARFRIALNRLALKVLTFSRPLSFVGPGAALSLCRSIVGAGARRVLVVTDAPLFRLGVLDPVLQALENAGVTVDMFTEVEPDPSFEVVLAGIERIRAGAPDAVLAIGGGSAMDCAKAMVISHANDCHPGQLAGLWLYAPPRKRGLPFYAIPTTAGTGSEVTIAAVVSDRAAGVKRAIIDPRMVPAMIALDPRLMTGLPPPITAATGMDALTHAIEAYVSTLATAETDELARIAVATIDTHLPACYRNGSDLSAREAMAVASCMAGLAFNRTGLGYVHAFAHQLGARYHLPHGRANAIVLPHVLDFSRSHCMPRLAALARAIGLGGAGDEDRSLADRFIARVREMRAAMAIPDTVAGLRREDFDAIIRNAFAEAHGTYAVPRYMRRDDARVLLEKLLP